MRTRLLMELFYPFRERLSTKNVNRHLRFAGRTNPVVIGIIRLEMPIPLFTDPLNPCLAFENILRQSVENFGMLGGESVSVLRFHTHTLPHSVRGVNPVPTKNLNFRNPPEIGYTFGVKISLIASQFHAAEFLIKTRYGMVQVNIIIPQTCLEFENDSSVKSFFDRFHALTLPLSLWFVKRREKKSSSEFADRKQGQFR